MEAIRRKQEPKIKPNSAYGLIPLESDYELPQNMQAAVGEHMYDVLPQHESNDKPPPQNTPVPPVLPDRPPNLGRSINVKGETQNSTAGASNADEGQLSKKGRAQQHEKRLEEDHDYKRMFLSLNRKATKLTPCQIDHLISMLKDIQGPVDDNEGKNAPEEHERCGEINIIAPQPRFVSPQPDEGNNLTNGKENSGKEGLSSSLSPPSSAKSPLPYYVNYLDAFGHEGEGSRSRCKVQDQEKEHHRSISPDSRSAYYVNYSEIMPQRSHSHCDLSTAVAAEMSEKKCKHPMPSPKPVFNSKPKSTRSHLQPKSDAHTNPSLTLSKFMC